MCIIFFITNANPSANEYKLILAANRDEYYARPALVAAPWEEHPFVFGGRDMEPGREGGTWLAMSTKQNVFKFGALLNLAGEIKAKNAEPRGNVVVSYVAGDQSNIKYCRQLINSEQKFNCFNLVTIEISDKIARPMHYSNVTNVIKEWPQNQVLGFGNSSPTKTLEKVKAGCKQFEEIVHQKQQTKNELVDNLMELLRNRKKHWPDSELHRRAPDWGDSLSSIYVKMPEHGFGSRTRSVILVDANNQVDFFEETMATTNPDDEWTRTHLRTDF